MALLRFDKANGLLDETRKLISSSCTVAQIRIYFERGRVLNSSGNPGASVAFFKKALDLAEPLKADFYAIDAAYMLAIVSTDENALLWNEKAIELIEKTGNTRAEGWLASIYNNLGWAYHSLNRHQEALALFEKRYAFLQKNHGDEFNLGIALWSMAKMH